VINESDEYALEEGLRIAEKTGRRGGGLLASARSGCSEALRKALAMGAARAVHLADDAFPAATRSPPAARSPPPIAPRGALRPGAHRLAVGRPVGYGATGSVVAGQLGWPHAWLVMGVESKTAASRQGGARDGERQERDPPPAAAGGARGAGRDQPPALRLAQGDHGGQAQADRPGERRPTSGSTLARSAPPARGSRSSRSLPEAGAGRRCSRATPRRPSPARWSTSCSKEARVL
jgi:hypothetical protein